MIEIKNLKKSYIKGKEVIRGIDLKIDNEIFGFLGLNGAGKTTTIKMMTGILDIDEGDILIDNFSIKEKDGIEAKKRFGYVPDNSDTFLTLKGIEYLNFISDIYDVSEEERKKQIEYFSKLFEINNVLNNKIESYSHGMRQKIAIIAALLHSPNNLIIDEPMTGLDPKAAYELKEIMKSYVKDKKTVFFSTHILEVAEKICDRIGIINKGELIFVGTIEEMKEKLKENKSLEELFMEITKNDE